MTETDTFVLIPGRTARQGTALNEGKYKSEYKDETQTLFMNVTDMRRRQVKAGDRVRLRSEWGVCDLVCKEGAKDEIPPGILFLPYGPPVCLLIGGNTHGSGMPDSKGIDVTLEPLDAAG